MRAMVRAAGICLCVAGAPASADRLSEGAGVTAALERAEPVVDASAPLAATTGDQGAPQAIAPAPRLRQPLGNPLWSIPLRTLSATRERPLFSPSRRPIAPTAPAAPTEPQPAPTPVALAPTAPERPQMTLVGTIVGPQARYALLQDDATHVVDRVREGDIEAGWLIRTVLARSIVVEKGAQSVTLGLPDPSEARGAADATDPQMITAPEPQQARLGSPVTNLEKRTH